MNKNKFEGLAKVQLENKQVGFIISSITVDETTEYRLGKKPDNNCYHEIMGWYPESMIVKTIRVYRKGKYIDVELDETN